MSNNIVLLEDLLESKERKEKELKFYEERLNSLLLRVSILKSEVNLTNKIIKMIKEESIIEIDK